ncbi:MAG: glycoside hydrolase family 125 protein, partial [Sediminibacterium sp.]
MQNNSRRKFIQSAAVLTTGFMANGITSKAFYSNEFTSKRPPLADRHFKSTAVKKFIDTLKPQIKDQDLAWLFENCYPNTLDTTVDFEMINGKPDTYVITGDIDAMWLRDSTAQITPYL